MFSISASFFGAEQRRYIHIGCSELIEWSIARTDIFLTGISFHNCNEYNRYLKGTMRIFITTESLQLAVSLNCIQTREHSICDSQDMAPLSRFSTAFRLQEQEIIFCSASFQLQFMLYSGAVDSKPKQSIFRFIGRQCSGDSGNGMRGYNTRAAAGWVLLMMSCRGRGESASGGWLVTSLANY
jgi:hypothetical protein